MVNLFRDWVVHVPRSTYRFAYEYVFTGLQAVNVGRVCLREDDTDVDHVRKDARSL